MTRLLIILALGVAGCGSPTVLDEKQFERACVSAGQCRAVKFGDVCSGCQCANGAVNEQGYYKYDLEKREMTCASPPQQCPCAAPTVACVNDVCVVE